MLRRTRIGWINRGSKFAGVRQLEMRRAKNTKKPRTTRRNARIAVTFVAGAVAGAVDVAVVVGAFVVAVVVAWWVWARVSSCAGRGDRSWRSIFRRPDI